MSLIRRVAGHLFGAREVPEAAADPAAPRSFEEQIYAAVIEEGDVCFDVGANFGEMALFFARRAGRGGMVVAFEPVMRVYCQLCTWVQLATDARAPVVTVPMGLAEAEKEATIQVPVGHFAMGTLAPSAAWSREHHAAEIASYPCRFTTLDRFLRTEGIAPPDFVKIDVEGAELLVLRGGAASFGAGWRPLIFMELFAPWERPFGYGPWDVLALLAGYGYRFLFACPDGLVAHQPTPERPLPPEFARGDNVLAFQPDAHAARVAALAGLRAGGATPRLPMKAPPVPNVVA
ncbi:MAG: FkbM family methyltransferase [Burkholderiales bacterium]|nr:FkbM family methyltransferase [Burkholderiales bacterium]